MLALSQTFSKRKYTDLCVGKTSYLTLMTLMLLMLVLKIRVQVKRRLTYG